MSWSSQPICERDWIDQNSEWEVAVPGDPPVEKLLSIRQPVRLKEPVIERCSWCGQPTIFGAYVRADSASVPYPRDDDD